MLLLIFVTILYCIIFWGFGNVLCQSYNSSGLKSIQLLKGILFIGTISLIAAFFIPLNFYYELTIIVIGVSLGIYFKFWNLFKTLDLVTILIFALSCFIASMNAFLYDSFSYYFPTIKWLDDYGFVKGLANFDFNLGQNSLWHIIQASFNETIDQFYKINTVLIILYALFLQELKQQKFLIFLPLFFLFVASPSPDLAIFVLSIISVLVYLKSETSESKKIGLLISAFLILIKPIAIILPLYFFILTVREFKIYKKEYFIITGLALLFFIKNIILTANYIFPISLGNLNFLSFSIPDVVYRLSSIDGKYLLTSRTNPVDYIDFGNWSFLKYITYLFKNIHFSFILYFLIFIFSVLILLYAYKYFRRNIFLLSFLVCLKCILFVFISMQYRFLLDGVLILFVLILFHKEFNIKMVISICLFAGIILVFNKNFALINKVHFLRGINQYSKKRILIPFNYSVKFKELYLFDQKVNFVSNSSVSSDFNQPVYNNSLLKKYLFQNYHPELIDSTDISKGFISVKNSEKDVKDIEETFSKIYKLKQ